MKVIVPQIGQSIAEATIVKWFKKPGDRIEKGEPLVEIGTDKINTEIPAPESGVVEQLLFAEGETVPVETEIAILSADGLRDVPAAAAEAPARHSPFVRKLAAEHNIDLETVRGTGAGGRVTKEDVMALIQNAPAPVVAPQESPSLEDRRVPMTRIRRLIAEHMSLSRKTAADVTTFFEVDMTEVVMRRDAARRQYESQYGLKLTYLPFVISAAVKALKAFPVVNASIEGEDIVYKKAVHFGVAVALEDGLIVPVVKNADQLSFHELARALQDLSDRARSKRLKPEDLEGGTFTITNPGVFGALMGTPIIHQPQVAILELGAVVKRPVVINDAIAIRSMAYLSLSYDHRAFDGAIADQFLAHIKRTLEQECPSPLD